MLSLSIGPLAIATSHVIALGSLAVAVLVGWRVGRRQRINPEPTIFALFLLGLLVSRVAFVAVYWPQYRDHPWHTIDIRDGGFLAWPGVLALLLGAAWRLWRHAGIRRPLASGMVVGLLCWSLGTVAIQYHERGQVLPQASLHDATAAPVRLAAHRGKPMVVNLWATWCPPCRREMPVLQAAQRARPDVTFLFVNQMESTQEVDRFLSSQRLAIDNLLFDSTGALSREVGAMALPTTLFYSAEGRLLDSHLGELSQASLQHALKRFGEAPFPSFPQRSAP